MAKENWEKESKSSFNKKMRNTVIVTALWATLVSWLGIYHVAKWKWKDKNTEKTEVVTKASATAKPGSTIDWEDATSWPNIEPDPKWWKNVRTETYKDEYDRTMIKHIYEDGSWTIEDSNNFVGYDYERDMDISHYDYIKYYPNWNKQIETSKNWTYYSDYIIYDENGKILYIECSAGALGDDGGKDIKFDEKGRIIYANGFKYIYDDVNKKVLKIYEFSNTKCKHIITYKMDENGCADDDGYTDDNILSYIVVGETGMEIDIMAWWLNKLIKDMNLESVPYKPVGWYIYKNWKLQGKK